ncbi:MAG: universal stress protein [Bacillota bacterium]
MFKKILVPVDGSALSMEAVRKAAALAERFESVLTIMHVVMTPVQSPMVDPAMLVIPPEVITALEEEGRRVLEMAKKEVPDGLTAMTVQKIGHPAQAIIELAGTGGYDLIVLGSRGLGEIRGFLLGSVSDRVSHHAPCSVLVVR